MAVLAGVEALLEAVTAVLGGVEASDLVKPESLVESLAEMEPA